MKAKLVIMCVYNSIKAMGRGHLYGAIVNGNVKLSWHNLPMRECIYYPPFGELRFKIQGDILISLELHSPTKSNKQEHALSPMEIEVTKQLDAYFKGDLKNFDLPYCLEGTNFQQSVWSELEKIPFGEIVTYDELATKMGHKDYSRAVGGACGKNTLLILVPCHRVIGASGKLTGFAAGLDWKSQLLNLEVETISC